MIKHYAIAVTRLFRLPTRKKKHNRGARSMAEKARILADKNSRRK